MPAKSADLEPVETLPTKPEPEMLAFTAAVNSGPVPPTTSSNVPVNFFAPKSTVNLASPSAVASPVL